MKFYMLVLSQGLNPSPQNILFVSVLNNRVYRLEYTTINVDIPKAKKFSLTKLNLQ